MVARKFAGTFNANNFYEFTNVNATSFSLSAIPGTSSDPYPRAPIDGIQIVAAAAPEPSQIAGMAIFVFGLGALVFKARRRSGLSA